MLAKDGTTLVEATTGTLDETSGVGTISKVQAKLLPASGAVIDPFNYNNLSNGGYWSATYPNLARNDSVQVQTNVNGVDANRTDVVTTLDTAKLRPDLFAHDLSGPTRAYVHRPVHFTVNVTELNGDVGARADCVLSIDGRQVDQALAIWVDAGRTVSCDFQPVFDTTGTHKLNVAVTNVVPADWDLANNSVNATIEIVDPIVPLGYTVSAGSGHFNYFSGGYYDGRGGYGTASYAYIDARTTRHSFALPVQQLSVLITADGSAIVNQSLSASDMSPINDNGYYKCSFSLAAGVSGNVCTRDGDTYSEAFFVRNYSDATYYGYYTEFYCDWWYCYQNRYYYQYNYNYGTPFDIGSSDKFLLTLTDSSGTTYRAETPEIPTQPYNYDYYNYGKSVFATAPSGDF
ncbi:MAG: hypothetical protein NVSMB64_13150 [Candidatus Velthaea sp.]